MNYLGPTNTNIKVVAPNFRQQYSLPTDCLPILAVDPGGTTGWSLLVLPRIWCEKDIFSWNFDVILKNRLIWEHGELNCIDAENEGAYQLCKMIDAWPSAVVVVEDFILRAVRREKSRELLSPVRITAKIDTHMWTKGRRMMLQSASQAKTTVTDDRLKFWGSYVRQGGLQHARDADRHALLFLRRCLGAGGIGTRTAAWPHVFVN